VHGKTAAGLWKRRPIWALNDRAAHAWRGITGSDARGSLVRRATPISISFTGMYECLICAEPERTGWCVLIAPWKPLVELRECAVVAQTAKTHRRSAWVRKTDAAMGISRKQTTRTNGNPLTSARCARITKFEVRVTPRIGITHCADWPLRFLIANNRLRQRLDVAYALCVPRRELVSTLE